MTLSAHASRGPFLEIALAHLGVLIAIGLIGVVVYIASANADRTTATLSASVIQGILRVISFILSCVGAQIMWNGFESVAKSMHWMTAELPEKAKGVLNASVGGREGVPCDKISVM